METFGLPWGRKHSIVGDHASYIQMLVSYMQISRSMWVPSIAEHPDGDVTKCRIPTKEIVGGILLVYMMMSSKNGSKGGDAVQTGS